MDGDFCSGQPIRIAFSVITLMVTSCDFCRMRDQGYILQDLGTDDGVFFYKVVFIIGQLCRFVQERIRDTDLSDVVKGVARFRFRISSGVQPSSSAIRAAYCATR